MSNRRSHRTLNLAASGREAELRVSRLILNVIVVGIIIAIIAVAIIPARLAGWTA
jgi:subtilase family serine protease